MSTRSDMANEYGLPPEAEWDDIYAAWKSKYAVRPRRGRNLVLSALIGIAILLISTHPLAFAAAGLLSVLAYAAIGALDKTLQALALEYECRGLSNRAPQIIAKARRDGLCE